MLSHLAVDRSMTHSVADAREAVSIFFRFFYCQKFTHLFFQLLNAAMDALKSYRESLPSYQRNDPSAVVVPPALKPFPLYISALLKSDAFRFVLDVQGPTYIRTPFWGKFDGPEIFG